MRILGTKTGIVLAVATSMVFIAEGFNTCLQENSTGVLGPADGCTPDEEGVLSLYDCDISDEDHEALTACVSVSPSSMLELDLGENSLSSVPEAFFADMGNLTDLSFFLNRAITTFPLGTFAGLNELKNLDLGWLSLVSLPAGLFDDVKKLEILTLEEQGDGFTELPDGLLEGLSELQRLGLSANGLTTLPANIFSSNTKLSFLNLGDNPITSLPETVFNGLKYIESITLTQSNTNRFDDDDGEADPHLTSLPAGLLAGLKRLTFLSVRGNLLTTLPEGLFADTRRLEDLSFANNELFELPEDTFLNLPSLITLDLSGNPDLQCKYEVDANVLESNIEWPEHLEGLSAGECLTEDDSARK